MSTPESLCPSKLPQTGAEGPSGHSGHQRRPLGLGPHILLQLLHAFACTSLWRRVPGGWWSGYDISDDGSFTACRSLGVDRRRVTWSKASAFRNGPSSKVLPEVLSPGVEPFHYQVFTFTLDKLCESKYMSIISCELLLAHK